MALSRADLAVIVRQMPIPVPWNRREFLRRVSEMRGRPIIAIPVDTSNLVDSPCGLWVSREHDDLLIHAAGTSEYHIDQIVCHEIGHMMLRHTPMLSHRDDTVDLCSALLPDIDPRTVKAVLARGEYNDEQEHEAEVFASLLTMSAAKTTDARSVVRSVFLRRR